MPTRRETVGKIPEEKNYLNVIQKQKEGSRNRGKANVNKGRVIERQTAV